jgi:hypothetical protein
MVQETLDDPNSDSYRKVTHKRYLAKLLKDLTGSESKGSRLRASLEEEIASIQRRRRAGLHSPDPRDSKDEAQSETDSIVPTKKKTKKGSGSRAGASSSNVTAKVEDRKGKGKTARKEQKRD